MRCFPLVSAAGEQGPQTPQVVCPTTVLCSAARGQVLQSGLQQGLLNPASLHLIPQGEWRPGRNLNLFFRDVCFPCPSFRTALTYDDREHQRSSI